MSMSQYNSFATAPNGTVMNYQRVNVSNLYNISEVTSGSVQFHLDLGTYYLIFQNSPFVYKCGSGCSNTVTVTVTQDFMLQGA